MKFSNDMANDLRIYRVNHARLAMVSSGLTTVHPDWLGILDLNGPGGSRRVYEILSWYETREETILYRYTWLVKRGLCDGVVLRNRLDYFNARTVVKLTFGKKWKVIVSPG